MAAGILVTIEYMKYALHIDIKVTLTFIMRVEKRTVINSQSDLSRIFPAASIALPPESAGWWQNSDY